MDAPALIFLTVLPALVLVAALKDLTTMTIPNWIAATLAIAFLPTAVLVGLSPAAIGIHIGIGVLALILGAGLFAARLLGGGDAKLMAACAIWMGVGGSAMFVLWTAVIGGAFSVILLLARARLGAFAANGPGWLTSLLEPRGDIPYGVAIAAGALMAYPASPLLATFIAG